MNKRTALVALAFLACSDGNPGEEPSSSSGNSLLLNFTVDSYYESGELRWMDIESATLNAGAISFWQDSRVSAGGGNIFVLSNYPGALACISPETIGDISAIKQFSISDANAPYEAAVIGSNGYIALNDADYVQVFNASTCALGEKIDLPIPNANASSIKSSGDTLLIALQRLEAYSATKPGLLARINATTKTLIDTIPLMFYNPHSSVLGKAKLYVSSLKYNEDYSIDLEKSGIEVIDLASGASEALLTGTQLGGGASSIALDEAAQTLYVSVYASYGDQPVKAVDLASKTVGAALPNITDSFGGLVFDEATRKLFAGDRDYASGGLKIYDPSTNTTTAANEGANPLLPSSLAIVRW